MDQGDKGKKMASFPKKKEANTAHKAIVRKTEESNSTMAGIVARKGRQLREYMLQKRRQMKAKVKTFLSKDKAKKKKRKKTMLKPILGSVLKYHKDDDLDPAAAAAAAETAA